MHNDFIDAGYKIFGLYGVDNKGNCECGNPECTAYFKHPRIRNWQHTPEWSEDQLDFMEESGQFNTGYGVLVSGLLVIDVDARNGGVESYNNLVEDYPSIIGSGLIVNTGSGKGSMHLYFKCPTGTAMMQHHEKYPGIDFKSSGFVVGPESMHASGNKYEVSIGSPFDIDDAPQGVIDLLKKPERHRAEINGQFVDITQQEIADMLSYIDPDCDHETWYRCGMAVHHATGGSGFSVWDDWSSNGDKYPGVNILEKRWHSFGKSSNPVTLGTLAHYAEQAGWESGVTFESNFEWDDNEEIDSEKDMPFSIDGVDLLRPPGFVGDVCQWINDQCRFPREQLAVAASLVAMGNICGLRYIDDMSGATANMFAFCVAGSSTGKESIQGAQIEIHKAAGISQATYGSIKSEQEIVRNLVRHQAAFYIIDELGIFLKKIINAQERGGASYLDGVIGELMKIYSKSDSYYLLTGDMKEAIQAQLLNELKSAKRAADEGTSPQIEAKIKGIESEIESIEQGLKNPYLSLVGYTTPITFNGMATIEQATNGFLGRSLIVEQRDTNPKPKKKFRKRKMTSEMAAALQNLYKPGEFDSTNSKVRHYGDRVEIKTDDKAAEMMDAVSDWLFYTYAEQHKESTGLEAIVRRGYELMAKISMILACPSGVRTAEHVRWAFAMMKRDIDEKVRIVITNQSKSKKSIYAKILGVISHDHGESTAVICNRLRPALRADVESALEKLSKDGEIKLIKGDRKKTGRPESDKWIVV